MTAGLPPPPQQPTGSSAPGTDLAGRPLFVLLNAGSGARNAVAARERIESVLGSAGRMRRLITLDKPRRIAEAAAKCVADARSAGGVVVVGGGDGTVNTVAHAVLGSGCALGVLPMGTFNYFSRDHGIPQDLEDALQVLLAGRIEPVQVGFVNERSFLVNASLGLYPQLLEDRERAKAQFGRHRFIALASAVKTLLRQHRVLRLQLRRDDRTDTIATPTLFVGNNRLQLEGIGIAEAEALERGQLAAVALHPVSSLGILALALRGSLGLLGDAEHIVSFRLRDMSVSVAGRRAPRIKVATDGEVRWMRLPLRFRVADEMLPLIVPADSTPDRA